MRRFLLPLGLLVVAVAATFLATSAGDDDPADATAAGPTAGSPVLSATRIPEWLRQPESDAMLSEAVLAVTTVLPFGLPDTLCVSVRRDGHPVPGHQDDVLHTPGELQRLVTAAATASVFPPEIPFTTDVVTVSGPAIAEGVLESDLWIIGRGDPTLSTANYTDRFADGRASTDIATLAADVAAALRGLGVSEIAGSVVADDRRFITEYDYRNEPLPDGGTVWDADDNAANVVGPLAALLVNDGFESFPVDVDQAANTRAADPALHAARVFSQLLASEGIIVQGPARNDDAPDGRTPLASISSPSRDDIIARALIDGTTAEMLFKEIGVRLGSEGQRFNAFFAVASTIDSLGVPPGTPADGSGLSDANAVSCETLVSLLDHPEVGPTLRTALPPVAESALADCAPVGAESMRLMAASEEDTVGVVGHVTADNGDLLTFAMIANHDDLASALGTPCNPLTGTLLEAVAGHPYGADLTELLPAPAVGG